MKKYHKLQTLILVFPLFLFISKINAQEKAVPVFENGEAQITEVFKKSKKWIIHDLWVETEFDTDGDGNRTECMSALRDLNKPKPKV